MAILPGPGNGGAGGSGGMAGAGGSGGTAGAGGSGGTAGAGGSNGTGSLPCTPVDPVRDQAILSDLDDAEPIPALQDLNLRKALTSLQCGEPRIVSETSGNQVSVVATHLPWTTNADDTTKLQNKHRYLVRVAGLDQAGNYGKLSEPQCSVPFEVRGYADAYADAGGLAGCNCAVPRDQGDLAALASGGLVAAAALLVRRRSKRRSMNKNNKMDKNSKMAASRREP
jgi:hypothetical protein